MHENWIWQKSSDEYNSYILARKLFIIPESEMSLGELRISADSRYVLYLNGERLGQGPSRSWPWKQEYDLYEIAHRLRSGENIIAVLINHFGISTFQYILGPGGLWVQLDWETEDGMKGEVITDNTWRIREDPAYDRLAPRISCQQAYSEIYDARKAFKGWTEVGFNDDDWDFAVDSARPQGELIKRSIPFLTEEPIYPERVTETRVVRSLDYICSVDIREAFLPHDRTANTFDIQGLLVGVIESAEDVESKIWRSAPRLTPFYLNGEEVSFDKRELGAIGEYAFVRFKQGKNLLIVDVSGRWHYPTVSMGFQDSISFDMVKFIRAEREEKTLICRSKSLEDIEEWRHCMKVLPPQSRKSIDVGVLTATAQAISHADSFITNVNNMVFPNEDVTIIKPNSEGDIEVLLDFGREVVGFIEFEIQGPEGVILDWNFFEGIQEGERLYTDKLNNSLRYITSGGLEVFHSIVRRGFRYASLTLRNLEEPLRIRWIRLILNTYPVGRGGDFVSSDPLLNDIWDMCAYTTRLCMEDTFVDCPSYEQAFWVGDSRNEALINYYTFGDLKVPARCWRLVAESLKRSDLPESQVPSGWQRILTAWSLLWVIACEEYYIYSGDKEYLSEIYIGMAKTCRNFENYINQDGLLEIEAWNMLDWAPMDTPNSGVVTHQNAWLVKALRRTANVAQILGKEDDAHYFLVTAEGLKEAINRHLWSEEAQAYIDSIHADGSCSQVISQQTNTVVYLCDVATPERMEIIARYVKEVPESWTRIGSPFMLFFTFEALVKQCDFERILYLTRENWGMMLKYGSTSCWEMFPQDRGMWTRSFCHAWSAAPAYFLSAYQLGVRPLAPGFSEVLIAPELVDLKWCKGRVPTPYGEVQVSWERDEEEFDLSVKIPKGISGQIVLPEFMNAKAHILKLIRGEADISLTQKGTWKVKFQDICRLIVELIR